MLKQLFSFSYLRDLQLDSVYLFFMMHGIGMGLIGIFIPIFLWDSGYAIWEILLFFILISAYFVLTGILTPFFLRGIEHRVLIGSSIFFMGLFLYGLTLLTKYPVLFFIVPAALAVNKLLFEIAYHLDLAHVADEGYIGRQVGFLYFIGGIAGISTPFIGALIASIFGFKLLFYIALMFLLVAIFPIWNLNSRSISEKFTLPHIYCYLTLKELRPFMNVRIVYGAEYIVHVVLWPLFVFLFIGELTAFGTLFSVGAFVTFSMQYVMGVFADKGYLRSIVVWSSFSYAFVGVLRAIMPFVTYLPAVVATHMFGKISQGAVYLPLAEKHVEVTKSADNPGVLNIGMLVLSHLSRAIIASVLLVLSLLLGTEVFFSFSFVIGAIVVLGYLKLRNPVHIN